MAVEVPADFPQLCRKLSAVSGVIISNFDDMIAALRKRHDFFAEQGCRLSDHGIEGILCRRLHRRRNQSYL